MTIRCLVLAAALALVASPVAAIGPAAASAPPAAAAPAAPAIPTGPRLLTPGESRDSASPPGDLRPERPVTPQISIPLGKAPPAPLKLPSRVAPRGNAAAANGIDDAAARCEAEPGEQVRAKCRDKLARETRSRAPQ